mgnify:FL=1
MDIDTVTTKDSTQASTTAAESVVKPHPLSGENRPLCLDLPREALDDLYYLAVLSEN